MTTEVQHLFEKLADHHTDVVVLEHYYMDGSARIAILDPESHLFRKWRIDVKYQNDRKEVILSSNSGSFRVSYHFAAVLAIMLNC